MARKRATTGGLSRLERRLDVAVREAPPPGTKLPADGDGPALVYVQQARRAIMGPCETRGEFQAWLRRYLGLDFPDVQVDEDSTGAPLDELWRVYHAGVTRDPDFPSRVLLYASRGSYKTLGVSALELLAMLHMDRNVVHLAAIEPQAEKAQEYLRNFLGREGLDEFNVGNNKRSVAVVWAVHKQTGDVIVRDEWKALSRDERRAYTYHARYSKVIVNTMQSSNSDHVAFFVVDEVDVIRFPQAYEEAKLIPEAQRDAEGREQPPITILTSTRKFRGGLVQREIDEAEGTGLSVRHWSILDVTRRCPDERHRPDLPRVKVWTAEESMGLMLEDEFQRLQDTDAKRAAEYTEREVYGGCVVNCPARVVCGCRGRLASQTSTAAMLKGIADTVGKFVTVSAEMAGAQLMCWQPGNEASVYKSFSRKRHVKSLAEVWELVTGEPHPSPADLTKAELVGKLRELGCKFAAGMDFGFTHVFAVCLWAILGKIAVLVDAFEVAQLELNQKVELCDRRLGPYKQQATVWPDPAYPSDIKTFRRAGWRMRVHTKDVLGGVDVVRNKLQPPRGGDPEVVLIGGDPPSDLMVQRFESYRWKTDAQGRPTDEPDDFEDDTMDATRYVLQNEFKPGGKVVVSPDELPVQGQPQAAQAKASTWMADHVRSLTSGAAEPESATKAVRKGSFFFDAG